MYVLKMAKHSICMYKMYLSIEICMCKEYSKQEVCLRACMNTRIYGWIYANLNLVPMAASTSFQCLCVNM